MYIFYITVAGGNKFIEMINYFGIKTFPLLTITKSDLISKTSHRLLPRL